jgi:hypothetical protein
MSKIPKPFTLKVEYRAVCGHLHKALHSAFELTTKGNIAIMHNFVGFLIFLSFLQAVHNSSVLLNGMMSTTFYPTFCT